MSLAPRSKAGFTLLEVVLAAAIGSIVAMACLGVFVTFDRADASLAARAREHEQLSALRLVVGRVAQSLVVAERPATSRKPGSSKDEGDDPAVGIDPGESLRGRADPELEAAKAKLAPRLELRRESEEQRQPLGVEVARALGVRATKFTSEPQRLQVVVQTSPVPQAGALSDVDALLKRVARQRAKDRREERQRRAKADGDVRDSALAPQEDEEPPSVLAARRGDLELRPMPARSPGQPSPGWEMWWVPRAPPDLPDSAPEGEAYQIATDLAYARWRVFQGRAFHEEFVTKIVDDLPAYLELEVQTLGGLEASWLFELNWSVGSELADTKPADPADVSGGGGKGGTPTPGEKGAK